MLTALPSTDTPVEVFASPCACDNCGRRVDVDNPLFSWRFGYRTTIAKFGKCRCGKHYYKREKKC